MSAKKTPAKKAAAKPTPPPEATSHPPVDQWLSLEENRERLAEILSDPVFLAAAHYVTEKNRLNVATLVTEAMPDSVIARRASVHAGCVEFLSGLRNLLNLKKIPVEPQPYEHLDKSPHNL
jgi:hypothetical protein